jgi:predicted nucleic acid-binding protein
VIVADTNLVAYFLVPNVATPHAERVRAREKSWAVPALFRHELLNVLGGYIRQGVMHRDRAARLYRRGLHVVDVRREEPDPLAVFQMAKDSGCSTYDLEFVWLARELNVPLVTSDRQVVKAFPDVAVPLEQFA